MGEIDTMAKAYLSDKMRFADAFNDGEAKGRDTTMVNNIRNLMETSGWDAQKTMDALKIPASEQEKYARQI